jgi:hypothetical protein
LIADTSKAAAAAAAESSSPHTQSVIYNSSFVIYNIIHTHHTYIIYSEDI